VIADGCAKLKGRLKTNIAAENLKMDVVCDLVRAAAGRKCA
jgi:hypothetical protein